MDSASRARLGIRTEKAGSLLGQVHNGQVEIPRPRFARMYMRTAPTAEKRGATEHRRRLLEGVRGTVVEIGAGQGLNFPHYAAEVGEVIAIEPEPTLREAAETAAANASVPIHVVAGVADELPVADAGADAVVASLVLCSVPDQQRALAEVRRVLRPGGELRFYEHVIPRDQPKRLLLQIIDRTGLWPAISGGCHPARDTTSAITRAGFEIEEIEHFGFAAQRFEPLIPHILGKARPA
jgi:ubiquinone/menaquinone biosynthesis C-methylase UbiE